MSIEFNAAGVSNLVAATAMIVSAWAVLTQRRHNQLSVRPLAYIWRGDYEDWLEIKICNHGTGPMLITKLEVSRRNEVKENIIDWMDSLPDPPIWGDFTKDLRGRSLAAGSEIILLQLSGDMNDPRFNLIRNQCRTILKDLSVEIQYTDIYNRSLPSERQHLTWFGRNVF